MGLDGEPAYIPKPDSYTEQPALHLKTWDYVSWLIKHSQLRKTFFFPKVE